jgi:hypothetical protein
MTKRSGESKSVEPCEESGKKSRPVTDEIGLKVLYDGVEFNGADPKSLVEYKH